MSGLPKPRKIYDTNIQFFVKEKDRKRLEVLKEITGRPFTDIERLFIGFLVYTEGALDFKRVPVKRPPDIFHVIPISVKDRRFIATIGKIKGRPVKRMICSWIHYMLNTFPEDFLIEVLKGCHDKKIMFKKLKDKYL